MKMNFLSKGIGVLLLFCGLTGCDDELKTDAALKDISVDKTSLELVIDDRTGVIASPVPWDAGNVDFKWSSANPEIATVNHSGQVLANAPGQTTLTVSQGNVSKSITVNVRQLTIGELMVGAWDFEDAANFGKALVGKSLVAYKMDGNKSVGSPSEEGLTSVAGPNGTKAVRVAKQTYLRCDHGIAPNGGGSKVNQYTMLIDFYLPVATRYSWLQTDLANSTDVDFFMRSNMYDFGFTGAYADLRETELMQAQKWYRMVIIANLGAGNTTKYFLNGLLVGTKVGLTLDNNYAWDKNGVYFICDEDGEDEEMDVAHIAIWDRPLTDAQVAELGVAGTAIK